MPFWLLRTDWRHSAITVSFWLLRTDWRHSAITAGVILIAQDRLKALSYHSVILIAQDRLKALSYHNNHSDCSGQTEGTQLSQLVSFWLLRTDWRHSAITAGVILIAQDRLKALSYHSVILIAQDRLKALSYHNIILIARDRLKALIYHSWCHSDCSGQTEGTQLSQCHSDCSGQTEGTQLSQYHSDCSGQTEGTQLSQLVSFWLLRTDWRHSAITVGVILIAQDRLKALSYHSWCHSDCSGQTEGTQLSQCHSDCSGQTEGTQLSQCHSDCSGQTEGTQLSQLVSFWLPRTDWRHSAITVGVILIAQDRLKALSYHSWCHSDCSGQTEGTQLSQCHSDCSGMTEGTQLSQCHSECSGLTEGTQLSQLVSFWFLRKDWRHSAITVGVILIAQDRLKALSYHSWCHSDCSGQTEGTQLSQCHFDCSGQTEGTQLSQLVLFWMLRTGWRHLAITVGVILIAQDRLKALSYHSWCHSDCSGQTEGTQLSQLVSFWLLRTDWRHSAITVGVILIAQDRLKALSYHSVILIAQDRLKALSYHSWYHSDCSGQTEGTQLSQLVSFWLLRTDWRHSAITVGVTLIAQDRLKALSYHSWCHSDCSGQTEGTQLSQLVSFWLLRTDWRHSAITVGVILIAQDRLEALSYHSWCHSDCSGQTEGTQLSQLVSFWLLRTDWRHSAITVGVILIAQDRLKALSYHSWCHSDCSGQTEGTQLSQFVSFWLLRTDWRHSAITVGVILIAQDRLKALSYHSWCHSDCSGQTEGTQLSQLVSIWLLRTDWRHSAITVGVILIAQDRLKALSYHSWCHSDFSGQTEGTQLSQCHSDCSGQTEGTQLSQCHSDCSGQTEGTQLSQCHSDCSGQTEGTQLSQLVSFWLLRTDWRHSAITVGVILIAQDRLKALSYHSWCHSDCSGQTKGTQLSQLVSFWLLRTDWRHSAITAGVILIAQDRLKALSYHSWCRSNCSGQTEGTQLSQCHSDCSGQTEGTQLSQLVSFWLLRTDWRLSAITISFWLLRTDWRHSAITVSFWLLRTDWRHSAITISFSLLRTDWRHSAITVSFWLLRTDWRHSAITVGVILIAQDRLKALSYHSWCHSDCSGQTEGTQLSQLVSFWLLRTDWRHSAITVSFWLLRTDWRHSAITVSFWLLRTDWRHSAITVGVILIAQDRLKALSYHSWCHSDCSGQTEGTQLSQCHIDCSGQTEGTQLSQCHSDCSGQTEGTQLSQCHSDCSGQTEGTQLSQLVSFWLLRTDWRHSAITVGVILIAQDRLKALSYHRWCHSDCSGQTEGTQLSQLVSFYCSGQTEGTQLSQCHSDCSGQTEGTQLSQLVSFWLLRTDWRHSAITVSYWLLRTDWRHSAITVSFWLLRTDWRHSAITVSFWLLRTDWRHSAITVGVILIAQDRLKALSYHSWCHSDCSGQTEGTQLSQVVSFWLLRADWRHSAITVGVILIAQDRLKALSYHSVILIAQDRLKALSYHSWCHSDCSGQTEGTQLSQCHSDCSGQTEGTQLSQLVSFWLLRTDWRHSAITVSFWLLRTDWRHSAITVGIILIAQDRLKALSYHSWCHSHCSGQTEGTQLSQLVSFWLLRTDWRHSAITVGVILIAQGRLKALSYHSVILIAQDRLKALSYHSVILIAQDRLKALSYHSWCHSDCSGQTEGTQLSQLVSFWLLRTDWRHSAITVGVILIAQGRLKALSYHSWCHSDCSGQTEGTQLSQCHSDCSGQTEGTQLSQCHSDCSGQTGGTQLSHLVSFWLLRTDWRHSAITFGVILIAQDRLKALSYHSWCHSDCSGQTEGTQLSQLVSFWLLRTDWRHSAITVSFWLLRTDWRHSAITVSFWLLRTDWRHSAITDVTLIALDRLKALSYHIHSDCSGQTEGTQLSQLMSLWLLRTDWRHSAITVSLWLLWTDWRHSAITVDVTLVAQDRLKAHKQNTSVLSFTLLQQGNLHFEILKRFVWVLGKLWSRSRSMSSTR